MGETAERRTERRHIVVGMEACVDGEACPILDISRSAVRVLRSPSIKCSSQTVELLFRVKERSGRNSREHRVTGQVIRQTNLDIVFGYKPPTRRWEATLRAHDTFHQTRLTDI